MVVIFIFERLEMREYLADGAFGLFGLRLLNGLLGKGIGSAQQARAHQAGEAQDQNHIG